jgi:chloramphenicol 3-O phosphotransferase
MDTGTKPGTILFLNGTSSSGKTTILRLLQERLAEPYLEAGIDKFIWMMPERYLDRPLWDEVLGRATEAGAAGHTLVRGMHRAIQALSLTGSNVLADHVLVEADWRRDAVKSFADLPAYLIGVRCPLAVLEERERSRKDRTLGQARAQFEVVHRDLVYDLEVDTSRLDPEACARAIIDRLQSPPEAFRRMKPML